MTKHFLQPILILLVILVPPMLNANGIVTLLSTLRKELKAAQKTAYSGSHEATMIDRHVKFLENFQLNSFSASGLE